MAAIAIRMGENGNRCCFPDRFCRFRRNSKAIAGLKYWLDRSSISHPFPTVPLIPHPMTRPTPRRFARLSSVSRAPRTRSNARRHRAGFTLLEILLVLTIIVVVGGLVGTNLIGAAADAKADASKAQMQLIKQGIERYRITIGGVPESLEVLVNGPSDAKKKAKWRNPIMDEIPTDAWDNEFVYTPKGSSYELRSVGEDGQTNTDDDVLLEGA